jgi:DNA-binding LytR/AlgR family response regulator
VLIQALPLPIQSPAFGASTGNTVRAFLVRAVTEKVFSALGDQWRSWSGNGGRAQRCVRWNLGKGFGVPGTSEQGIGIYGRGAELAGRFEGDVEVSGSLVVSGINVAALAQNALNNGHQMETLHQEVQSLRRQIQTLQQEVASLAPSAVLGGSAAPTISLSRGAASGQNFVIYRVSGSGFSRNDSVTTHVVNKSEFGNPSTSDTPAVADAFEVNVPAYLLGPVGTERQRQAVERGCRLNAFTDDKEAEQQSILRAAQEAAKPLRRVVCRARDRLLLVPVEQILWFQVEGGIVKARTVSDSFWVNYQLNELEAALPEDLFFRARREVLVNLTQIKEIKPYFKSGFLLIMSDAAATEIVVSERQTHAFRHRLPGL